MLLPEIQLNVPKVVQFEGQLKYKNNCPSYCMSFSLTLTDVTERSGDGKCVASYLTFIVLYYKLYFL